MTGFTRARLFARFAFVFPFLLGPQLLRLGVRPVGDALAAAITFVVPPVAAAQPPHEPPVDHEPPVSRDEGAPTNAADEGEPSVRPVLRSPGALHGHPAVLVAAADAGARVPAGDGGASVGTIVVPASVVAKAIERKDIGASNSKGPDGTPIGARIHGVSRYRAGLRDGDVIVSVAGTRTPTTAALVDVAMRVLAGGATRLTGKIARGEETWNVVLELPSPP